MYNLKRSNVLNSSAYEIMAIILNSDQQKHRQVIKIALRDDLQSIKLRLNMKYVKL